MDYFSLLLKYHFYLKGTMKVEFFKKISARQHITDNNFLSLKIQYIWDTYLCKRKMLYLSLNLTGL